MGTVLLLGGTLSSLADPLIIRWLIDSGLPRRSWPDIALAITLFCAVYALRMGFVYGGTLLSTRVFNILALRIRLRLLRRIQKLDASYFEQRPVGELTQRLEQDVDQAARVGVDLLPLLVRIGVSVVATVVVMAALDWRLTAVVLPFVPALICLRIYFRRVLESAAEAARAAIGGRAGFLNEAVSAGIQVQLMGAEPFVRRRFTREAVRASRAQVEQRRRELLYLVGSLGISTAATAAVLSAGAYQVVVGSLTVGSFVALYSYLVRLLEPLSAAVETYSAVKRAGGSIRRLVELERTEPAVRERAYAVRMGKGDIGEIRCRDVGYAYSGGQPLLRSADLRITRGERVSLIGRSGSGKSTLAKLMARIHDVGSGSVHLGTENIRDVSIRSVRDAISFVPA